MSQLSKIGALALVIVSAASGACGGNKHAHTPGKNPKLVPALSQAFREEATGDPIKAVDLYLDALSMAAGSPEDPSSVSIAMASLEALVHQDVSAFAEASTTTALADRIDPEVLRKKGGGLDERLAKIQGDSEGPFVRSLVAYARLALAERRGDDKAATEHRAATGCAREGLLAGPVAWMPVTGAREPAVLDRKGAAPTSVSSPSAFAPQITPAKINAFGCHLPLYAQTSVPGVREIAIDIEVPSSGWIGLGLRSSATATLQSGGKVLLDRPHSSGARTVARFSRVETTSGVLRVVARAGMDSDYANIEIGAWDEDGKPLKIRAAGASADAQVKNVSPVALSGDVKNDPERLALALGALAANESRIAENVLHAQVTRTDAPPDLLLVYARAVRAARDLPSVKSQERARAAYDRVLEAWPASWEAIVEHAVLAGARRGQSEARLEALADLDKLREKTKSTSPLLDAFEAETAGREHVYDRAHAAFEKASGPLRGTRLLHDVNRLAFERTGRENVAFECEASTTRDATSLGCHRAQSAVGDRAAAERELARLRSLSGSSQLYLSLSSRDAIEAGDLSRAAKILDAMNPGDRPLSTLYAVKGKSAVPELLRLAVTARDAPSSLPALLRDAGDDPLAKFEGVAERVAKIGSATEGANDATAVLAHEERYDVEPSGLVHATLLDVRRVMGTTDVDSNAQAPTPMLYGKDTMRVLRRRIFKKDGRIILPDPTPRAAQSHADLSQLEAGDAVEAIYEGWGIPGETGNIGIDTPDLLPERTSVREATIELRLPQGLKGSLWSHPLLGKAAEKTDGGKRVLTWRVKDRGIRRLESGVPKMDRNVAISFSTTTWTDVARGLRETVAALDSDSPEVTQWAQQIADAAKAQGAQPAAIVGAIVTASGQAVKESSGIVLSDVDLGRAGAATTARSILATHEGSRTWLVVKALRDLGIPTDVVVAENEPFSDSADFPPHFGRFMHPLAVAHVAGSDVWIDADVAGPPLPAGRISPELRGRNALWADGKIAPLPAIAGGAENDEIDIRLAIDDQGNAKGTITVLLRGRSAQDLAEALVRIVGLERQRALRGIALGWVPFATVEKVELSSSEGSWQIAVRAELTAPAYAQIEGTKPGSRTWVLPGIDPVHYVFPRPFVTTLSSTYASHGARENALAINHATQYHVRRRVELPAKAQIARLPGPFDGKGPLLSASRKIEVANNAIVEDFVLDVTTGTIARDRYDAFVIEAHRTDDAFQASTRVKPPTP